jgi:endonuclease/exonuclease/phosphatase family metal-dependent hydrolase
MARLIPRVVPHRSFFERRDRSSPDRTLRIVSYNVHRCRGLDGRMRPLRVADVLTELDPDIVALQEVIGSGPSSEGQAATIARALDMEWVMAPTRLHRGHQFGNVVMSRVPIVDHEQYDLTYPKRQPRCCQRAVLRIGEAALNVYNVHLGTAMFERRRQAPQLAAFVSDPHVEGPRIILGDFNEWVRGLTSETLEGRFSSIDLRPYLKARRTYPGILPLVHLDHLYYDGPIEVVGLAFPRTRRTLVASDHLPLVVDVRIAWSPAPEEPAPAEVTG